MESHVNESRIAAALFDRYLSKVASVLPHEKQGPVRRLQAGMADGNGIMDAVGQAFPKLAAEARQAVAVMLAVKSLEWAKAAMSAGGAAPPSPPPSPGGAGAGTPMANSPPVQAPPASPEPNPAMAVPPPAPTPMPQPAPVAQAPATPMPMKMGRLQELRASPTARDFMRSVLKQAKVPDSRINELLSK